MPLPPVSSDPVVLALPVPPSTNDLWTFFRSRPTKSAKYKIWLRDAGWSLQEQRPGRIEGRYEIQVIVPPINADLDNSIKAISDLLQKHKVIANDRLCRRVVLDWDEARKTDTVQVVVSPRV